LLVICSCANVIFVLRPLIGHYTVIFCNNYFYGDLYEIQEGVIVLEYAT